MTTQPLPSITPKQQAILKLIYKYRFLNRIQIQTLLKHKDKRRIISWLKDLREKQYVDWHYNSTDFIAKSQPGIYYLSLNGIRHLRSLNQYPNEELRKRYKEPTRTQAFINHCLLIADSATALQAKSNDELKYGCVLPADYVDPDSKYHFLDEIKPHLFFSKQQGENTTNYLLESFEPTLPRYQLRKRLKDYVEYLSSGDWDDTFGPQPIVLFVCPSTAGLLYVKRQVRKLLEDEDIENVSIRVTIIEKLKAESVVSRIWEEI
jgi:hypothetical protein